MEIYFDNAATTRCTESVCLAVTECMTQCYGNPSSLHRKGMEAEQRLRKAREVIADTLKCSDREVFFTSGGTESDNWAVLQGARARRRAGTHLITTAVEHPAVLEPMKALEAQGFTVTYLPVDENGAIRLEDLSAALCEKTILVSIMYVNNEIGTIQPVEEAAAMVKAYNPSILFHTDAVQAYGKMSIRPGKAGIDLLSASGHKIHGPKGTGFLYVREGTRLSPLILGGGQQRGMRSGTDNVPGAAGLAQAALESTAGLKEHADAMLAVKNRILQGLSELEGVVVHGDEKEGTVPWILNASFTGVRSEVMLHALEEEGICVSAGSACSSNKHQNVSAVLRQMHLPAAQAESALRFSFSRQNTLQEADACIAAIQKLLPVLRRYSRR